MCHDSVRYRWNVMIVLSSLMIVLTGCKDGSFWSRKAPKGEEELATARNSGKWTGTAQKKIRGYELRSIGPLK